MSNAQVFADFMAECGGGVATMLIYTDGLVVWLAATAATAAKIKRRLEKKFGNIVIDDARSTDGFGSVFVLKPIKWEAWGGYPSIGLETMAIGNLLDKATGGLEYQDNRERDQNTIGAFVEVLSHKMAH
jgi:hypothetical protein